MKNTKYVARTKIWTTAPLKLIAYIAYIAKYRNTYSTSAIML